MPWLEIHNFNGKDYHSIVFSKDKKQHGGFLSSYEYIELDDATVTQNSLDELIRRYKEKEEINKQAKKQLDEEYKAYLKTKQEHDNLVYRIERIIRENHHKGEVESAKGFYEKITGNPWVDK